MGHSKKYVWLSAAAQGPTKRDAPFSWGGLDCPQARRKNQLVSVAVPNEARFSERGSRKEVKLIASMRSLSFSSSENPLLDQLQESVCLQIHLQDGRRCEAL